MQAAVADPGILDLWVMHPFLLTKGAKDDVAAPSPLPGSAAGIGLGTRPGSASAAAGAAATGSDPSSRGDGLANREDASSRSTSADYSAVSSADGEPLGGAAAATSSSGRPGTAPGDPTPEEIAALYADTGSAAAAAGLDFPFDSTGLSVDDDGTEGLAVGGDGSGPPRAGGGRAAVVDLLAAPL